MTSGAPEPPRDVGVSILSIWVRYAETDQMGVAHHSHYLVWCEAARTEHLRRLGVGYRTLEEQGLRLVVVDARVRFRAPARFDDLLAVQCWAREVSRRAVVFGYAIHRQGEAHCLATAQTSLIALNSSHALGTIPQEVRDHLVVVSPDPVRL